MGVAPEVEGPALLMQHSGEIAKALSIGFAILLILIGIIVTAATKSASGKIAGVLLLLFGAGVGYLGVRRSRKA